MSYAIYHPGKATASTKTIFDSLGIPSDPLGAHLWIVAGVAPGIIHRLAELVKVDVGMICGLTGISRSIISRKLRTHTSLSISQGARVYGAILVLDAVLSLHQNDTVRAFSWLNRAAWGLGGVAPAELLKTQMGVQAVIDLVGRIQHGVCN